MALAAGWSWHLDATPPRRVLRVGAIQMGYTLEEKRGATLERRRRLFERFIDQLESIEPDRYDLLVASEGAYPLFWDLEVDTPEASARNALSTRSTRGVQRAITSGPRTPIIVGGLRRPAGGKLRNSAVHLGADGHLAGSYDKRILVPFGETMPFSDVFPSLRTAVRGVGDFAPGEEPCRFEAAGERVACGICYESIFPGFTRETAQDDATLLVNLTIDVWFGRSTAPWFHLMVQASRAAELGVPLIRSALTGISAVVGPDGVPIALMPLGAAGVLEADVPLRDVVTPYRVVGPVFGWLCLLASLGLLALARRDSAASGASAVGAGPSETTAAGGVATR
jgi:apolipoprotein N-acyltransferase